MKASAIEYRLLTIENLKGRAFSNFISQSSGLTGSSIEKSGDPPIERLRKKNLQS
jgi:hypothetical protein